VLFFKIKQTNKRNKKKRNKEGKKKHGNSRNTIVHHYVAWLSSQKQITKINQSDCFIACPVWSSSSANFFEKI